MDSSLRLASLTAFYFGAHVAAVAPTDPVLIDSVSHRAYRDLCRTLTGIGTHPDKTSLLKDTHTSLHEFVTSLETVTARDEFDARHDTWCQDRVKSFKAHPHSHKGKEFTFTYGHAQKWINMTMKYLAVLDHPSVQHVYPYLHVPIDSIVYEEAEHPTAGIDVPRPPGGISWSGLDRSQYLTYQTQLRTRIAAQNDYLAPLDWEATAWIARNSATEN